MAVTTTALHTYSTNMPLFHCHRPSFLHPARTREEVLSKGRRLLRMLRNLMHLSQWPHTPLAFPRPPVKKKLHAMSFRLYLSPLQKPALVGFTSPRQAPHHTRTSLHHRLP